MIPALLICVYVVYLYSTLNRPDDPPRCLPSESKCSDSTSLTELSSRLEHLEQRLSALSAEDGGPHS